jgi:hypothetical protein
LIVLIMVISPAQEPDIAALQQIAPQQIAPQQIAPQQIKTWL